MYCRSLVYSPILYLRVLMLTGFLFFILKPRNISHTKWFGRLLLHSGLFLCCCWIRYAMLWSRILKFIRFIHLVINSLSPQMVFMDLKERAALLVVFMGLALYNVISARVILTNHLATQICLQQWCLDARVCLIYNDVEIISSSVIFHG